MESRGAEGELGMRRFAVTRPRSIQDDGIGPHGASDILEVMFAQISELDRDLPANLIVSGRRDANAARFRDALKPRRNIDAVTEDVVALDQDVAEVDPDPEQHTLVLRDAIVALGHHRLHSDRALDRIDNRRKLKQQTVPRGLDDPATMLCHKCIGNGPVSTEDTGGADLVEAHKARIARHVGGQYRRQSPVDPTWPLLHHAHATSSCDGCTITPAAAPTMLRIGSAERQAGCQQDFVKVKR